MTNEELVAKYESALEPLRKKFHDFQNSQYRGEWDQIMMRAGEVRDLIEALPPSEKYPHITRHKPYTPPAESRVIDKVAYGDHLQPDQQISTEEKIAAYLHTQATDWGGEIQEDHAADAGRDILYLVLREFRPDVFDDAHETPATTLMWRGKQVGLIRNEDNPQSLCLATFHNDEVEYFLVTLADDGYLELPGGVGADLPTDSGGHILTRVEPSSTNETSAIFVVVQQGGASNEWYASTYDDRLEALQAIVSHHRATYSSIGPYELESQTEGNWCELIGDACGDAVFGQYADPAAALAELREAGVAIEDAEEKEEDIDSWEDDPEYPVADWQHEVAEDSTRLGYTEWVSHQRESGAAEQESSPEAYVTMYLVVLKKRYRQRKHGGARDVFGAMPVTADTQGAAEQQVQAMLNDPENTLQTNDSRIKWDTDLEELRSAGYEYEDESFVLDTEADSEDIDAKYTH